MINYTYVDFGPIYFSLNFYSRKLVLLKLEKGLNFGDAIVDNVYNQELLESNKESENPEDKNVVPIASTSIFSEVEKLEKTLCVIAEKNILDG